MSGNIIHSNFEQDRVDTTIGELVEAITQVALEAGRTEAEGYKLAALALEDILKRKSKKTRSARA